MTDTDDRRRELLALLLEEEGVDAEAAPAPRLERSSLTEAPLSRAQARMWFEQQRDPDSTVANMQSGMRVRGDFDPARFHESLLRAAARHEALRTTYHDGPDGPVQRVHDALEVPFEVFDADGPQQAADALAEVAGCVFDLEREAPVRVAVARLADDDHLLTVVLHHIACDDLTFGVLLPEVAAHYRGEAFDAPPAVQPIDIGVWERARLETDDPGGDLAYWRERLEPAPPRLALPFDRRRPAVPSNEAGFVEAPFPAGCAERVAEFARDRGATRFMVLLAGFVALLSRATGDDDIAIATPAVLRDDPQLAQLVGNLVNTLVLRTDASGEPTFAQLLDRVRDVAAGAFDHQELPFDLLVERLAVRRAPAHHPLVDVMFLVYRSTVEGVELPGAEVTEARMHPGMSVFDLTVTVLDAPDELLPGAFYRRDLYDEATVRALLETYGRLVDAALREPDRPIVTLPLMDVADDDADLPDGDAAGVGAADARDGAGAHVATRASGPATVAEAFALAVAAHPDRVALVAGDVSLTYRELDARAASLADRLVATGARPGERVAVLLPPGVDLVVAIAAVVRTGAAYVPVDVEQPAARASAIIAGARVVAAVAGPDGADALPERVPAIDPGAPGDHAAADDAARTPAEPTPGAAGADDPVYVIHTSGSTGEPKGVIVTHANVLRLFDTTRERLGIDERDVWTLFHSAAFDFSVWELWGALLHGGRLVVVPRATARDPEAFCDLLERERVTVLNQTPRAFAALDRVDAERTARGAAPELALRLVVFGGEALDPAALAGWLERHPESPRLVNMYGLTEATVHATWLDVDAHVAAHAPGSPIGRALPDLRIRLLDPDGRPVPAGIVGEMHVEGPGVAAGYLDRPEQTAHRFANGRYRTGDLARRRADGSLEYLGRADTQLKVRGYRVEAGEIEQALREHVADAVVLADGDRLVAHVAAPAGLDAAALRARLAARLPEYMLPAAVVRHDRLPLTANGKADRRALARANAQAQAPAAAAGREVEAAADALERRVADVWAGALRVPEVGRHDNFFDLGGHSLLLATLRPRIEAAAGAPVSIVDLYANPTVASLAEHLRATDAGASPAHETAPARDRARRARDAALARRTKGRQ